MLFDGIRDQKIKSSWIKTPQPVVIKLQTMRCMRDKIPKGDYVLRVGVLDRLVENKMYYKFFEYGNRVKEQKHIQEEREKNKFKYRTIEEMDIDMSNQFQMEESNADDSDEESDDDESIPV
jgi:Ran GTPase-activating protein (RanGAP) involved in mRNA processing and transport